MSQRLVRSSVSRHKPTHHRGTQPLFRSTSAPVAERVEDLLSRLTLEEKIGQMSFRSPAVKRLGIPEYVWWNECSHGVGRAGRATVFPHAIGQAATFDVRLVRRVADAVADEARAKHHAAERAGVREMYTGLTFWTPNINLFRDPRWGRGQETYGEDPYLTARMAVACVRGLQGDHPTYLKVAACAKHYAVHSGPELLRHGFDAKVSPKDLWETYLPAFEAAVTEAGVEAVMGAYNRTNGHPCCAHPYLINDVLRGRWGFKGHFVSDCGAVEDFHAHHKVTATPEESAALAVRLGCDLCCGGVYGNLGAAVEQGLVSEEEITAAARRTLTARFRLGQFDPPAKVPFAQVPASVVDGPAHRELALDAARASIVLLKNDRDLLPLPKDLKKIAVVGPNAYSIDALMGNYNGTNPRMVTVLEGIVGKVSPHTVIAEVPGSALVGAAPDNWGVFDFHTKGADVVVAVLGLSPRVEGEEGDTMFSAAGGDRKRVELPEAQEALLRHLCATHERVVVVLMSGSALAVPFAKENAGAIVQAWYPGQAGGEAVADVLFGDYNPGGRLPVTFYAATEDLPRFEDYSMANRTYRYFTGTPLYPFGYGLSYTTFRYSGLKVSGSGTRKVSVTVTNTGRRAGDEVVQLYVGQDSPLASPNPRLAGFTRVHLKPRQGKTVTFYLRPQDLAVVDESGARRQVPGTITLYVGGGQPAFTRCVRSRIKVT